MKKTNRELAEFYGIEDGDTVTVYDEGGVVYGVFECKDLDAMCPLKAITCRDICIHSMGIGHIRNRRYEVSKPKKKYGETKCSDYKHCEGCPVRIFMCGEIEKDADFYTGVDKLFDNYQYGKDSPIYIALKAELDKEVE